MRRPSSWPIRGQIGLLIAVLAIPFLALLALQAVSEFEEHRQAAADRMAVVARAAASEQEQFLSRTATLLASLARRPGILAMDGSRCDAIFGEFLQPDRAFTNLVLADADGRVVCSALHLADARAVRLPRSVMEAVRKALAAGELAISQPEIGFISGRWAIAAVHPVRDVSGRGLGVIGVGVDLERLSPLGNRLTTATGDASVLLVNGEGLILAVGGMTGKRVGMRLGREETEFLRDTAFRDWAVAGSGSQAGLYARAQVAGTEWLAVARQDFAPIEAVLWRHVQSLAGIFAAILLFSVWMARRIEAAIIGPVDRLAGFAASVSAGGLGERVVPQGGRELRSVAEAFNGMLDRLGGEMQHVRRSEEDLKNVLASVDEVVYELSDDGRTLRYLGPGADTLFGVRARHLAAQPDLRYSRVLTEDRAIVDGLAHSLEQDGSGEAEYRVRGGEGRVRWLRERCRLLRDADGRIWKRTSIVSDVTALRELVEELKKSEGRFRSLVELSADWYWEQDAEFRFVDISDAPGSWVSEYFTSDMVGKRRWEMPVKGLGEAQWAAHRAQLSRHEDFRNMEFGLELPDGRETWVSISGGPIFDQAGRFSGYRGVGTDVTVRKQIEAALNESEARLRWVLQATSEGVWDFDLGSRHTYFSERFAELLGYADREDLRHGFIFSEVLHANDRERVLAARERTLDGGARFDEVFRLRRKDGRWGWFHGRGVLREEDGLPAHFIGALRDVTVQHEADERLRKLSAAIEQSPVSVLIANRHGVIEYVNPHFCRSSGYSPEEVLGRNTRILKSGETPREVYATLWQTILRGEKWAGELHNRRKNGELYWEHVRIFPLVAESGETEHFVAVKEDITLRKELTEREQLRQEQMLHHARLAAMGEMAAALAHELNQPLAAIANFSGVVEHQLGAHQPDLAQAREVVRTINSQALRAGEIVWRVREFSRKQEARREPIDINGLVSEVVRLADIAARSREVAYEYHLAPGLPPVPVDRVQIEQVLLNLIRNGVEAMEAVPGEKRLTLSSHLAECGSAVQVTVRDRGSGLPDRIAVDLFTPFFTTKPEGMGMGLSICRGIIESHGGRLWAAPDEAGGTAFHFTLPLQAGGA